MHLFFHEIFFQKGSSYYREIEFETKDVIVEYIFKNTFTPLWLLVGCELKIVYQRRFQSACNIKHRWQTSVDHAKTMNHEKQEHSALQQALLSYAPGLHRRPLGQGPQISIDFLCHRKHLKKPVPCGQTYFRLLAVTSYQRSAELDFINRYFCFYFDLFDFQI